MSRKGGYMKMRIALLALTCMIGAAANAQVSSAPFPPILTENFNTTAPGPYISFPGFGGNAVFQRIGNGQLVVNNNPTVLPIFNPPHNMYGYDANVRIKFNAIWRRFGGGFRMANMGVLVTTATFRFFKAGLPVGVAVSAPISSTGWTWIGWNCNPIGGFDEVRIFGNGPIAGLVGMDTLRVR